MDNCKWHKSASSGQAKSTPILKKALSVLKSYPSMTYKLAVAKMRLKKKGLVRLEGKEYVMKDGDVTHFRFNV